MLGDPLEGQEARAAERAYALASRTYPEDPAKVAEACAAYDTMVRLSLASSAQILLGPVQAEAGGDEAMEASRAELRPNEEDQDAHRESREATRRGQEARARHVP